MDMSTLWAWLTKLWKPWPSRNSGFSTGSLHSCVSLREGRSVLQTCLVQSNMDVFREENGFYQRNLPLQMHPQDEMVVLGVQEKLTRKRRPRFFRITLKLWIVSVRWPSHYSAVAYPSHFTLWIIDKWLNLQFGTPKSWTDIHIWGFPYMKLPQTGWSII